MFHFLDKTLHGDKKPGGGVFGFLDEQRKNPKKAVKKAADIYTTPVRAYGGLVKDTAQYVARTPETLVRSAAQAGTDLATKEAGVPKIDRSSGKNTGVRKVLYGEEPVQTYQKRTEGNKKVIGESRFRNYADPLAALGLVGTVIGDVTLGGGGKKKGVDALVKASTSQEVKKILGQIPDHTAQAIANSKDKNVIQNIVSGNRLPSPPDVNIPPPVKPTTPEPQVNPKIAHLENELKHTKEMRQHAANDTAKKKLDSKARRLIGEKEKLNAEDLKINNPVEVAERAKSDKQWKLYDTQANSAMDKLSTATSAGEKKQARDMANESIRLRNDRYSEISKEPGSIVSKLRGAAQQAHLSKADRNQEGFIKLPGKAPKEQVPPSTIPEQKIVDSSTKNIKQDIIPPVSDNAAQDIADYMKGTKIGKVQNEVTKSISEQRGKRLGAAHATAQKTKGGGSEGFFKEVSQLGGKYERPELGGMIDNLGPQKAEELFSKARDQIIDLPDSVFATYIKDNGIKGLQPVAARINLQKALRKVIFGEGGGVPTRGELKLIKHVNPELGVQIESRLPKHRQLYEFASQLVGLPRALQATFDLSMGGRQGILVAARHPKIWADANLKSFKMFGSEDYYHKAMADLRGRESYPLAERYGVRTPATQGAHEEAYASPDLAERIYGIGKGVKAAARAYDGGLAKMRMDLWDSLLNKYGGVGEVEKKLGPQGMKDLAEVVNTMTGRGGKKGGLVETHMKTLSTTLFSPRLWAARLNTLNPHYYYRLKPAARREALEAAGAFAGVAGAVLTAAAALGADVETDPRSSDFLKLKFGDTRYDVLGGFQQNLVFAWRELSGETKSSQSGHVTKYARSVADIAKGKSSEEAGVSTSPLKGNRLTKAGDLATNKLNPVFSTGSRIISGKDKAGNPVNPAAELGLLFVPLNAQGAVETIKHTGSGEFTPSNIAKGTAKNVPNTFGVGTQSYGVKDIRPTDKQQKYLKTLKDKKLAEASKSFFQYQKVGPDRDDAAKRIKEKLTAGDKDGALKIARQYNKEYKKSFDEWRKKYPDYRTDKTLIKVYKKKQITSESIKRMISDIKKGDSL